MRRGYLGRTVAVLVILLAACNPLDAQIAPREAVDTYHERYNAHEFESIWRDSHAHFKRAVDRQEFEARLAHQRTVFGALRASQGVGVHYMRNLSGGADQWKLVMASTFEHGRGQETFLVSAGDREPRIIGYHLQIQPAAGRIEALGRSWQNPTDAAPPPPVIVVEGKR